MSSPGAPSPVRNFTQHTRGKHIEAKLHAVNWFDISATDYQRAAAFYETIFATMLHGEDMGPHQLAVFPSIKEKNGVSGAVMAGPHYTPNDKGVVIYLNCEPSIDAVPALIDKACGSVLVPKTALPADIGVIAMIRDTEGERIGLHASR